MHRLPVEELKEGMILAEPILDPVGRVLLGKGEALTRLYINKLERWGIYEVSVDSGDVGKLEAMIGGDLQAGEARDTSQAALQIEARLERRFKEVTESEAMGIIKALARKHLVEQAQSEAEGA